MKISAKNFTAIALVGLAALGFIGINGCVEGKQLAEKNGMKLWSENCQRCHFSPSSNAFSNEEWKTVGMHMQSRALLTSNERDKIIEFLQN